MQNQNHYVILCRLLAAGTQWCLRYGRLTSVRRESISNSLPNETVIVNATGMIPTSYGVDALREGLVLRLMQHL